MRSMGHAPSAARPAAPSLPESVEPMLSADAALPADEEAYGYEFKWDGIRTVVHLDGDGVRLQGRRLTDLTPQYPELQGLARAMKRTPMILDGEIVCLNAKGVPDFGLLQQRMNLADAWAIKRRRADLPVTLLVFDVLAVDGRSIMDRPYRDRRAVLDELAIDGPHWHTPPYFPRRGRATLDAARDLGMEGVVAKRLDSVYEEGRRSGAWIKAKIVRHDEFVVAGWTHGEGARKGRIGALLLGYRAAPGAKLLEFAGRVGTGFTDAELLRLQRLLAGLATPRSPFRETARLPPGAHFVRPQLVAEVGYTEWTHNRTLRHPRYLGLRADKPARDVVVPLPVPSNA